MLSARPTRTPVEDSEIEREDPVGSPKEAGGPQRPFLTGAREAPSASAWLTRLRAAKPGQSFAGASLIGADLRGLELSMLDLSSADLSGADLSGAKLIGANLRGAILHDARLHDAELMKADLRDSNLSSADATRAGFGHANLSGANAFGARFDHASLVEASLHDADFRASSLKHARLCKADLSDANFSRSHMHDCDLEAAHLERAQFIETDLRRARLRNVSKFETATFIHADIRDIDFSGAYLVRRQIMDENYLHEFRYQNRASAVWCWLWWVTSDCGRSLVRWSAWTAALTVFFGYAYQYFDIDYGNHPTSLSAYYFSLVTLTTLGFGDVLPASLPAQVLVMTEVVLGYVMLGGLLSMFASKMGRRAD